MNRTTINRILFVILCICDAFALYTLRNTGFLGTTFIVLIGIVLIAVKYPIYEVCFYVINRKMIRRSIKSVVLSIIFDLVVSVATAFKIFTLDAVAITKLLSTIITIGVRVVFLFYLLVLKGMMVIDISLPASGGKLDL